MKLARIRQENSTELAIVKKHALFPLIENYAYLAGQGRTPLAWAQSGVEALLAAGDDAMAIVRRAYEAVDLPYRIPIDHALLLSPIHRPSKIIAIGLNYWDHCHEQNVKPPDHPIVFTKFSTAIVGPEATVQWDPALTQKVDFEAELAVVIGKTARHVRKEVALDYVAGYTCANDISARDLQFGDKQWVRGKSLDTFAPLGPWLVTADEIASPNQLTIRSTVNGQIMQDSNTAEMIFDIPTLIAFASRAFTLLPGDIILTGTPNGVGVFREPPVFLHDGDEVTVEITGIGTLHNHCRELTP